MHILRIGVQIILISPKARLVLADGRTVIANDTKNEDLFWGIRGGGSNFGVCTEFVFRLHEQRPTVYSGILIYPPPLVDQVLKATEEWWKGKPSPDTCLLQAITRGPPPDFSVCSSDAVRVLLS